MPALPESTKSLWRVSSPGALYPALTHDLDIDVAVVGAGITGLTAAYLLKQQGLRVAVLEKDTVSGGTTGRTTGKVTSQHSLIYYDLAERLGTKTARTYGLANQAALGQIEQIITKETIMCDWQRSDNYVYTTQSERVAKFEREAKVAAGLGLPASFETSTHLPFEIKAGVKFAHQAKLNAVAYTNGLANTVDGSGSFVFEKSNVTSIRDGQTVRLKTKHATIHAQHAIVATNVPTAPLLARGAYCALEYPTESYIVAGKLNKPLPGMYISPDDHHYSILPFESGNGRHILIGGESNISGIRGSTTAKYQRLAQYAEKHFGVETITHKWSDRDYLSYDGPPLIGKLYPWSKHLYVATAFRKWGLTNGTVAGMVLCDQIIGNDNSWTEIFKPNRWKPIANIPRTALHYLTGQH